MSNTDSDTYQLQRFVNAQDGIYSRVLEELHAGEKRSHWMWYIFPQIKGLGHSDMAQKYAISDMAEAQAYLAHPLLGERLRECTSAVLNHSGASAAEIFGYPDDLKFCSSMTLFSHASQKPEPFSEAIRQFCDGKADPRTLQLLGII